MNSNPKHGLGDEAAASGIAVNVAIARERGIGPDIEHDLNVEIDIAIELDIGARLVVAIVIHVWIDIGFDVDTGVTHAFVIEIDLELTDGVSNDLGFTIATSRVPGIDIALTVDTAVGLAKRGK